MLLWWLDWSFLLPDQKIEEMQDKVIIEQSVSMLKEIDQTIQEVGEGEIGNKRKIEVTIKKGSLEIFPEDNNLSFKIESRYLYSEPGQEYQEGNLKIITVEKGKYNDLTINMTIDSSLYDLEYQGGEDKKIITKSPNPYNFFISKKQGTPAIINFEVE